MVLVEEDVVLAEEGMVLVEEGIGTSGRGYWY